MKKYTNEFKVGLFVILCLLGLFYLTYSTGKLNIKKDGYYIYAVFNEIVGVEEKSPVRLNGFEVGRVDDIKISYGNDKTQIILKLWLDSSAKIRENPIVSVKTLGLMGEKYIEITSYEGSTFVKPGSTLYGKAYLDLDAMMQQIQGVSKEITQQINQLLATINTTVGENKDSISAIIKNLEVTSKNFQEFSSDIKRHPWKLLFKTKEKPQKQK